MQFGRLGVVYNRARWGVERPRVAVLTIGEEAGKGNDLVKATCDLMESTDWAAAGAEFVGNVEGRDLMAGVADVVVCDGFTGNVVLKSLEGLMAIARFQIEQALRSTPEVAATLDVVDPVLEPVFNTLDAAQTGAAILLGVRGVSMISHGSASSDTIARAIRTASLMSDEDVTGQLRAAMEAAS